MLIILISDSCALLWQVFILLRAKCLQDLDVTRVAEAGVGAEAVVEVVTRVEVAGERMKGHGWRGARVEVYHQDQDQGQGRDHLDAGFVEAELGHHHLALSWAKTQSFWIRVFLLQIWHQTRQAMQNYLPCLRSMGKF